MSDSQRVETSNEMTSAIERASSADLAFLAMDTGKVPQQFAVILILDQPGDFGLSELRKLISKRILAVPRLRQRLIKVPPGCGRSVWTDDPDFHIDHHVRAISCQAPGDEHALLEGALSVIMTPLRKDAPLWSIVLITDLADGGAALVVVLHHVIADGLGGLSVLAALLDPGLPPGHQVSAAIPIGVGDRGNMTVYFEVLSYAGVLTIAVIVDPDHGPDLGALTRLLQSELDSIMASP